MLPSLSRIAMPVILPTGMPRYLTGEPTASPSTEVLSTVIARYFGAKICMIPAERNPTISRVIAISRNAPNLNLFASFIVSQLSP